MSPCSHVAPQSCRYCDGTAADEREVARSRRARLDSAFAAQRAEARLARRYGPVELHAAGKTYRAEPRHHLDHNDNPIVVGWYLTIDGVHQHQEWPTRDEAVTGVAAAAPDLIGGAA